MASKKSSSPRNPPEKRGEGEGVGAEERQDGSYRKARGGIIAASKKDRSLNQRKDQGRGGMEI